MISRLAVVGTLLGTKEVARGQQQDFEGCTCDSSDNFLSGTAYTNCQSEPFGGAPITLDNVAGDISSLPDGVPADVTITSFPCITTSSQSVDFDFGSREIPNLAEVRFANWVTGPDGLFKVRTLLLPFLSHLLLRALPYVLLQ